MAGQASRENGKKGGRPKGFAALAAERIREKVAQEVEDNFDKYWKPQFNKAKMGDTQAFKEIREFAFGKPRQLMGIEGSDEGSPIMVESMKELTNDELERILKAS